MAKSGYEYALKLARRFTVKMFGAPDKASPVITRVILSLITLVNFGEFLLLNVGDTGDYVNDYASSFYKIPVARDSIIYAQSIYTKPIMHRITVQYKAG